MSKKYAVAILVLIGALMLWGLSQWQSAEAQGNPTPTVIAQDRGTPAPVLLPSNTPTATDLPPTPTRTPTSQGRPYVEAKNPDANVRSGPGTEYDRLGIIQPGEPYFVIGASFEWYQIEFPNSATGTAWVFDGVVNVFGDINLIGNLSQDAIPTIDPAIAAQAETLIAATQTPGGLLTLTVQAQLAPQDIFTTTPIPTSTLAFGERLPTFTLPVYTATYIPIEQLEAQRVDAETGSEEPFAPAIPILGLIGLGVVGLLIGIFRRL